MTTHKELAEFILAFDRGEKVETNSQGNWEPVTGQNWTTQREYRIVKQPVKRKAECWIDGAFEYRWLSPEAGKIENAHFKRIPQLDMEWEETE